MAADRDRKHARIWRLGRRSLPLMPIAVAGIVLAGCGSPAAQHGSPPTTVQARVVAQALAQRTQTAKQREIATVEALATAVVLNGNGAATRFKASAASQAAHRPRHHTLARPRTPTPTPTPTATPTPPPATALPEARPTPVRHQTFRAVKGHLTAHQKHTRHVRPAPVVTQVASHSARRHSRHHSTHATNPTPVAVAMAQPTVHEPSRAELAYRAQLSTMIFRIGAASTALKRSAGSIDPAHADFDPSVLHGVTDSIDSANRSLEAARASLVSMSAPPSFLQAEQETHVAIEQYQTAAQHLRQAVSELEAGTLETSSNDLSVGTSSLQQGDQALQNAQSLLTSAQ